MNVTKAKAALIRDQIAEAAATILAQHGLELSPMSGGTYGETFAMKIVATLPAPEDAPNGVNPHTEEARAFLAYAPFWGINPELLGQTVTLSRLGACTILGANPRAQKYPVLVKRQSDGATYKVGHLSILTAGNA